MILKKKPFKSIERKRENAGNHHFLLFPRCFLPIPRRTSVVKSSANTLSVEQSKYCTSYILNLTAAVAYWLKRLHRERGVLGLIPTCGRPKGLKLGVVALPLCTQDYGNSTMTGPPVSVKWTG